MIEENYKEGKKDGAARFYYSNGHLAYDDRYENAVRIKRKAFDEQGQLIAQEP